MQTYSLSHSVVIAASDFLRVVAKSLQKINICIFVRVLNYMLMEDFTDKLFSINKVSVTVLVIIIVFAALMPVLAILLLSIAISSLATYLTLINKSLETTSLIIYLLLSWLIPFAGGIIIILVNRKELTST